MMVVRDDGIDFDGGDVMAAGGQRARDVPSAAGSDDERLGAGADVVGKRDRLLAAVRGLFAVRWSKSKLAMPVARRHRCRSSPPPFSMACDPDARNGSFPLRPPFRSRAWALAGAALGIVHVDEWVLPLVVSKHGDQQRARRRRCPRARAPIRPCCARRRRPRRSRWRPAMTVLGPAESIEQRHQQEAAAGGAERGRRNRRGPRARWFSEMASETMVPETKKGRAVVKYIIARLQSLGDSPCNRMTASVTAPIAR